MATKRQRSLTLGLALAVAMCITFTPAHAADRTLEQKFKALKIADVADLTPKTGIQLFQFINEDAQEDLYDEYEKLAEKLGDRFGEMDDECMGSDEEDGFDMDDAAGSGSEASGSRDSRDPDFMAFYTREGRCPPTLTPEQELQLKTTKQQHGALAYKKLITMISDLDHGAEVSREEEGRNVAFAMNKLDELWMTHQIPVDMDGAFKDPAMEGYEREQTPMPPQQTCTVCLSEPSMVGNVPGTGCRAHCKVTCYDCLKRYLTSQIDDGQVMPWIRCPGWPKDHKGRGKKCKHLIELPIIKQLLADIQADERSPKYTYKLAAEVLRKNLLRRNEWVPCENGACRDGFVCLGPNQNTRAPDALDEDVARTGGTFGIQELECESCHRLQSVRKTIPLEYVRLINDRNDDDVNGSWGISTCCGRHEFKQYGVCNSMECGQCGMSYNWYDARGKTAAGQRPTVAYDSEHLKKKAREQGTLWMSPGQSSHFQSLSTPDKKKFVEANGGVWDPNYVPGGGF